MREQDGRGPTLRRYAVVQTGFSPVVYCSFPAGTKEQAVKEGIHPKYYDIEARCACGATWKTRSTKPELHLEICNNCHPFFTGRQKLIDTEGRVDRFTKRFGAQTSESRKAAAAAAKTAKTKKTAGAAK
jgi:large subunit ribosomal protein L31